MSETGSVLELFGRALELAPEPREELLQRESERDPDRAAEVRVLLGLHDDLEDIDFLRTPSRSDDETGAGVRDEAGSPVIGNYRILESIGRGGMALVYLAEQRQPIWRRVAIKVLRRGIESPDALARFQLERQALAVMDHPNVAKVLDTGTTKSGLPYFVLEYVPGLSITAYSWRHNLTLRERLELFLQVCSAIKHAHQKGIIHRDIKPLNILVADEGGQATVRVIDFGIAKAISHRLTQETLHTRHGQLIGTPEYMSPEQIQLDGTNVDTRTDVYSLGVLLYEMLTGVSPFAGADDGTKSISEIRDAVLLQEPVRPSSAASPENPRLRGAAVPVAGRRLKGDLDWILLKALAKDRRRRYGTAHELAEDIERHLEDAPVNAGPPSVSYLLTKFVRRHRAASLIALMFLALGIFVGVSTVFLLERVERESHESLSMHQAILRNLATPVVTFPCGDSTTFVEVNHAALDVFGYTETEFTQLTVVDISAEPEKTRTAVGMLTAGDLVRVDDREFRRKDGSTFHATIYAGKYSWSSQDMCVGVFAQHEEPSVGR